jgi:hypothetical protein
MYQGPVLFGFREMRSTVLPGGRFDTINPWTPFPVMSAALSGLNLGKLLLLASTSQKKTLRLGSLLPGCNN